MYDDGLSFVSFEQCGPFLILVLMDTMVQRIIHSLMKTYKICYFPTKIFAATCNFYDKLRFYSVKDIRNIQIINPNHLFQINVSEYESHF